MKEGTFLVESADDTAATIRDVGDGQFLALAANPGLEEGQVLEATVEPDPPLEVAYRIVDVDDRRTIPVERSSESPTTLAREIAADQATGEITRRERAGEGEIHVLTVPPDRTNRAAEDVAADPETVARAARLGADRVEIRVVEGVLSVRYLPD